MALAEPRAPCFTVPNASWPITIRMRLRLPAALSFINSSQTVCGAPLDSLGMARAGLRETGDGRAS